MSASQSFWSIGSNFTDKQWVPLAQQVKEKRACVEAVKELVMVIDVSLQIRSSILFYHEKPSEKVLACLSTKLGKHFVSLGSFKAKADKKIWTGEVI